MSNLSLNRVKQLLEASAKTRVLVVGDVMLDQFIYGRVSRISPEAPVPVVDFQREIAMPGGAANVARNLTALGGQASLFGAVGRDEGAHRLAALLKEQKVACDGLLEMSSRMTTRKERIIAGQQQIARIDRETRGELDAEHSEKLLASIRKLLPQVSAVIVGDYGKGVVTQPLLDGIKAAARARGLWVSLDPKPVHQLELGGLSLITPNRKEAFELAAVPDTASRATDPLKDANLLKVADKILNTLQPALLLITLSELGMLLCRRGEKPFHIPTVAREVFDVSGAGDTVIASFTLAIAAGASPIEAAVFSNHAGGVVVGKVGTATVTPEELLASFKRD
ncbi:MAG: D-glycero-beta-D-manno-heptose-7-phosphate kinase [Verrucomicrobia bacterium]|nr:D-glycero-beta-D-manno-heptose-7-phosphate kinase [Verrucomicrobiota bacterium]